MPRFPIRLSLSASFNPEPTATVDGTVTVGSGLNEIGLDTTNRTVDESMDGGRVSNRRLYLSTSRLLNCPCRSLYQGAVMESVPPVPTSEPPRKPAAEGVRDGAQETDVWWGAYAGRTMLPSFVACILLTASITAIWLSWVEYQVSSLEARYTAYAVIGPLWLVQVGRWLYRTLTYTYRLTTRRLYLERTFFHVPARIVDLGQILEVRVESSALERKLNVGRIRLRTENPQLSEVTLEGVHEPERIAARIRELATQTRRVSEGG